jgi:TusA-related sulfurtransferase
MRKNKPDATLDIREWIAPLSLLKVENRLASMETGQILEVLSTDKETKVDLARIAKNAGYGFVSTTEDTETFRIFIERR